MTLALDATYSLGKNLSGVGVYSREILYGLAATGRYHWLWCYRPKPFLRALREPAPPGVRRRPFLDGFVPRARLFHGLNQRLPSGRLPPAVATFHDLFVISGDYSTPEFRQRMTAQARDAAARAALIIAVSDFTASQVSALLDVERSRIHVVHHGIRFPAALSERKPEQLVLTVGALQTRKNTLRLVEAFESMPAGWRLVLAGSHGYGAEAILARVQASPRRQDIELPGWIDDNRLQEYYRRTAIFAFPSLDEGFGIPVLEAMAWGIPVITANRSSLPEVAGDAALLIDPLRTDELAHALTRLASDSALADRLAAAGLARAQHFTWTAAVAKTLAVYERLL